MQGRQAWLITVVLMRHDLHTADAPGAWRWHSPHLHRLAHMCASTVLTKMHALHLPSPLLPARTCVQVCLVVIRGEQAAVLGRQVQAVQDLRQTHSVT